MKLVILSFKTLSGDRLVGSADCSQVWFWTKKKKRLSGVLTKSGFTTMQNTENSTPLTSYSVITLPVCPLCFCVQSSQAKHWRPLELLMKESKNSHVGCFVQCRSLYVSACVSLLHPLDCAAPVNTAASCWCSRGSKCPHMDLVTTLDAHFRSHNKAMRGVLHVCVWEGNTTNAYNPGAQLLPLL